MQFFRWELLRRYKILNGVRFFTPALLRIELSKQWGLPFRSLPLSTLIPWRVDGNLSRSAIGDFARLKTSQRIDLQIDKSPWENLEAAGFISNALWDERLKFAAKSIWDIFCSAGFFEGDWPHCDLLQAGNLAARESAHGFLRSPPVSSVERWRREWRYGNSFPVDISDSNENVGELNACPRMIYAKNESASVKIILGKIAEIFLQTHGNCHIALLFSATETALRHRLAAELNHLQCVHHEEISDDFRSWNNIFVAWIAFQRRPHRQECIQLLRAYCYGEFFSLEKLGEFRRTIDAICRQHFRDFCSDEFPEAIQFYAKLLPQRGSPLLFWENSQAVLGENVNALAEAFQRLQLAYGELSRDGYLDWLEANLNEPSQESSMADSVSFWDWQEAFYLPASHLIFADLSTKSFPEKWAQNSFLPKNESHLTHSAIESYAVSIGEQLSLRDKRLKWLWNRPHVFGVLPLEGNALLDEEMPLPAAFLPVISPENLERSRCAGKHYESVASRWNSVISANFSAAANENAAAEKMLLPIEKTAESYQLRRRGDLPWGIFDFGMTAESDAPIWSVERIPAKAWERALCAPEEVWLRYILGINSWKAASIFEEMPFLSGIEIHEKLAQFVEIFKEFCRQMKCDRKSSEKSKSLHGKDLEAKNTADLAINWEQFFQEKQISAIIDAKRRATIFDWQRALDDQMAGRIRDLSRQLRQLLIADDWDAIASEFAFSGITILDDSPPIFIHGRTDLLLRGNSLQIVDFKTRANGESFTEAGIRRGKFLQLALYGLHYWRQGQEGVLQILMPFSAPKSLEFSKLDALKDFWSDFARLQNSLRFGYGNVSFGKTPFFAYSYLKPPDDRIAMRRKITYPSFQ